MANSSGNRRSALRWEISGFLFIVITGSMLHFMFEWTGRLEWVALFAAVNESTWEHLKLAFFPSFIFALIEYPFIRNKVKNFSVAKTLSFYVIPLLIIALFYLYLVIFRKDSLFWDIFIFVFSVGIGQIVSYKILVSKEFSKTVRSTFKVLFLVILIAFLFFTYLPPHNFLFKDPISGGYGIIK
ncbi:MAG: DUF6512 family protein [Caldiserica bacterium]|nr:DUF6512 family protein [Caldisericota bacterium]